MKTSLALLILGVCFAAAAHAEETCRRRHGPIKDDWNTYRKFHGKRYKTEDHHDEAQRIFEENKAEIQAHNKLFEQGKVLNRKELNKYADWSKEKFQSRNKAILPESFVQEQKKLQRRRRKRGLTGDLALVDESFPPPPRSFNWRNVSGVSYVTPAKSQGECGSCFIFASLGALESQVLIAKKFEQSFSEEQVADCIFTYPAKHEGIKQMAADSNGNGCDGGFVPYTWEYIKEAGGITTEHEYDYTLMKTNVSKPCTFKKSTAVAQVGQIDGVWKQTEHLLKQLLVNKGPLTVSLNADNLGWNAHGIFHETDTSHTNHAVLLVGYGTDRASGEDYWEMKNSWGTNWGDDHGFFRVSRDKKKNAGITDSEHSHAHWVTLA